MPSGLNATAFTASLWPVEGFAAWATRTHVPQPHGPVRPAGGEQSVVRAEGDRREARPGGHVEARPAWPPGATSQNRTVPSQLADASNLPSRLNATSCTWSVWPVSSHDAWVRRASPVMRPPGPAASDLVAGEAQALKPGEHRHVGLAFHEPVRLAAKLSRQRQACLRLRLLVAAGSARTPGDERDEKQRREARCENSQPPVRSPGSVELPGGQASAGVEELGCSSG